MARFRTFLITPGSKAEMVRKAPRFGADGLVYDLEDSVPKARRSEARDLVNHAMSTAETSVFVRVNHPSTGELEADLEAVVSEGLIGVLLPKAEGAADVEAVADKLSSLEDGRLVSSHQVAILPMVESCRGLLTLADTVAASPRVRGIVFSSGEEGDFMTDLGGRWTDRGEAMLFPRSNSVCHARAAGLEWILDGVVMNLDNREALSHESRLARTLGFTGKLAIHPSQLPVIRDAFTPTRQEVEYSRGLIQAFRDAETRGEAAIRYQGTMVDYANVKRATRILEEAEDSQVSSTEWSP